MITFANLQINGTRTFDAPRNVASTDVPTGLEKLVIEVTLEPADLVNQALSMTIAVWASFDNGATFPQRIARGTWRGDASNTVNPIKVVTPVLLASLIGVRLRGEIITSARMRLSGGVFVRVPLADE